MRPCVSNVMRSSGSRAHAPLKLISSIRCDDRTTSCCRPSAPISNAMRPENRRKLKSICEASLARTSTPVRRQALTAGDQNTSTSGAARHGSAKRTQAPCGCRGDSPRQTIHANIRFPRLHRGNKGSITKEISVVGRIAAKILPPPIALRKRSDVFVVLRLSRPVWANGKYCTHHGQSFEVRASAYTESWVCCRRREQIRGLQCPAVPKPPPPITGSRILEFRDCWQVKAAHFLYSP